NDNLNIVSTLVPGPDHNPDGTLAPVAAHGGLTSVHGGGNSLLQFSADDPATNALNIDPDAPPATRPPTPTDGHSWANAGFAVGQQVLVSIDGGISGSYTVTAIGDQFHAPGSILYLLGAPGAPALTHQAAVTGQVSVTDYLAVTATFDVQSD